MDIITVKDLMDRLKITRQTIYRLRKKGLPTLRLDGNIRFDYDEVIRWMKRGE